MSIVFSFPVNCDVIIIIIIIIIIDWYWYYYYSKSESSQTAQKMKFSIKDFFNKCDQTRIWLYRYFFNQLVQYFPLKHSFTS